MCISNSLFILLSLSFDYTLYVNNLTPLEALNKLNDIKRIVKGK